MIHIRVDIVEIIGLGRVRESLRFIQSSIAQNNRHCHLTAGFKLNTRPYSEYS